VVFDDRAGVPVNAGWLYKAKNRMCQIQTAGALDLGCTLALSLVGRRCGAAEVDIATQTPADPQVSPTVWF
jgi:hypothetical protein